MSDAGGSLLDCLDADERRQLLSQTTRRKFKRGEVLFHDGDPGDTLHLIDKGHVAIRTTTPLGDVATFAVLGPGDVFGEQAVLREGDRRSATAVAVELAETRTLRRDQFEQLRRAHPQIDRFLIEVLVAQVRQLNSHLQEALYVPAETRVLRRVLSLVASYTEADGGCVIPLTQDDVATMAGTSRPTANRVLKAAEADGVLRIGRGRIDVLDAAALTERAR
jgi:CRP/FNR family cyclic AMP-dependent transcriptional regulator